MEHVDGSKLPKDIVNLNCIDTSNITTFYRLFNCKQRPSLFDNPECFVFDTAEQQYGINFDISEWDVSSVLSFSFAFAYCASFNCDIGGWDVSNVQTMTRAFMDCRSFDCDLSGWDTRSLRKAEYMLKNCSKFNSPINWEHIENVVTLQGMLYDAITFNRDLSSWEIPNYVNTLDMLRDTPIENTYSKHPKLVGMV